MDIEKVRAQGRARAAAQRARQKSGQPFVRQPWPDRFWSKVDTSGGSEACWPWLGYRTRAGYGKCAPTHQDRNLWAHRIAYELVVGPIPEGLQIDHLCRNPGCVNPAHMEPVTQKENSLRGISPTADNARKTHCLRGHEFTPENVRWYRGRGYSERICRACRREWDRAHRAGRVLS